MADTKQAGLVILAGAGPGDPELITLRLQRRLTESDVIITDRLVNPAIIELHARKNALVLFTGKQGFNLASYTQEEINQLMIDHAQQGKTVLRLKGGDVAFFSNVLHELNALNYYNIPFEIIPGVTAAGGAAAYAGIPLTARGYAQAVQFLTYHPATIYPTEKWKSLANSDDTLVFYMAARNTDQLAELLLRYSKRPNTPMAVIEQATTPYQQVHLSTLKNCAADFSGKRFSSPSLVIVGSVVTLHEKFAWHPNAAQTGSVFKEIDTVLKSI